MYRWNKYKKEIAEAAVTRAKNLRRKITGKSKVVPIKGTLERAEMAWREPGDGKRGSD